MRISLSLVSAFLASQAAAFTTVSSPRASTAALQGTAKELGIPCEDECAIDQYPNLPPSVHPGVLSGQAQMDLLKHAKENGKILLYPIIDMYIFDLEKRYILVDGIHCQKAMPMAGRFSVIKACVSLLLLLVELARC